jgi:hypothetical protein
VALLPGGPPSGLLLPVAGLEGARLRTGAESLRSALEAHLWLEGAYPDSLEALRPTNPELLAAFPPHRYSYARIGGSYELEVRAGPAGER